MIDAASRQRSNKLSIAVVLLLMVAAFAMATLGLAGQRTPQQLWDSLFASAADGSWIAIAFDGRPVASKYYLVAIRRGKVIGGYDDCNGWSFQDEEPDRKGERMIISTLQECPDDKLDGTYWVLVHASKIDLLNDQELRLSRADTMDCLGAANQTGDECGVCHSDGIAISALDPLRTFIW